MARFNIEDLNTKEGIIRYKRYFKEKEINNRK